MAVFADWSATPNVNVSIDGINVGENCPPANLNNAIRSIMAACKTFDNAKADASLLVPKTGAVFTTVPTVQSRGAVWHFRNAGSSSGEVVIQSASAAKPTPAEGMVLLTF